MVSDNFRIQVNLRKIKELQVNLHSICKALGTTHQVVPPTKSLSVPNREDLEIQASGVQLRKNISLIRDPMIHHGHSECR